MIAMIGIGQRILNFAVRFTLDTGVILADVKLRRRLNRGGIAGAVVGWVAVCAVGAVIADTGAVVDHFGARGKRVVHDHGELGHATGATG